MDGAAGRDVLLVDGMFCAACAASVEAVLAKHPGVRAATVNFAAQAAVVEWAADDGPAPRESALPAILHRIERLGYHARLAGVPGGETRASDRTAGAANRAPPAKDLTFRLVIAAFFGMWVMLPSIALYLPYGVGDDTTARRALALATGLFAIPVVAWCGLPFYRMAFNTLRTGVAGVDALVTVGVVGAVVLSVWSLATGGSDTYFEVAVALITLQLLARLMDVHTRRGVREALTRLLDLAPTQIHRVDREGGEEDVLLKETAVGDTVRVYPGERLAVDGEVREGCSQVDRRLLSGEAAPAVVRPGDCVHAGEQLLDGTLLVDVRAVSGKRRIDGLARQVRQALASKPPWQRLADRLARYVLWLSLIIALVTGGVVASATGDAYAGALRALAVFVITCPCALSLAAPLAALCASEAAAAQGVLLRDLNAITTAAVPTHIFVDKTGTLTEGMPKVARVTPFAPGLSAQEVLALAAVAERGAQHPLAQAILAAASPDRVQSTGGTHHVVSGGGVLWRADPSESLGQGEALAPQSIQVGSHRWLCESGVQMAGACSPTDATTSEAWVARDGVLVGRIDLEDPLRPGVAAAVDALRASGREVVILSGDNQRAVAHVACRLNIEGVGDLLPQEKVARMEQLRAAVRRAASAVSGKGLRIGGHRNNAVIAFVGDGLNDGPALAYADLGIATGNAADAARAAAAVSLTPPAGLASVPDLLQLTRRLRGVIRQNLAWAVLYNAVALPLAAAGWVHPAVAAVAMALSAISITLNALRLRPWSRDAQAIDAQVSASVA